MLFHGTDAFLTIGSKSSEFYRAFGISEERLFFTPYSVDNDFFREESRKWRRQKAVLKVSLGISEELPVILFVGKLVKRKRPFDLLYAYENIGNEVALVFVGDGELRSALEQYVRERGLSRVKFVGFKNQSELPRYYAMADIFALPSSSQEVSPLVINEAMCCALPVVVSDAVPSANDFVENGYNGYIYPCGDVSRLTQVLHNLILAPELESVFGERSQQLIEDWNNSKVVEGILEALGKFARQ
ncbi:MAG: glycosyltransferase [Candidatus Neomarinimicrobiota bacterium]